MRDIEPATIALSESYDAMNFIGLSSLAVREKPRDVLPHLHLPYCPARLHVFKRIGSKNFTLDNWSIGMVLLEILVGTEIVIMIKGTDCVEDILDILERYLDWGTLKLLEYLLLFRGAVDAATYIKEYLDPAPTLIADNIRRLQIAIE